jgi:hypothetical protein
LPVVMGFSEGAALMPSSGERVELIDDEMAHHLRALSGAERLRIASGMFTAARRMLSSHLAATHPEWDERTLLAEVTRRLSGAG